MSREHILRMLTKMVATFLDDPPDSDFQRGYLAALEETIRAIEANRYAD